VRRRSGCGRCRAARSAAPAATSATPSTTHRRRDRVMPRRPASAATTSWRAAIQAGTSAASSPVATASPAKPASASGNTRKPPDLEWTRCSSSSGRPAAARATPSPTPRAAATAPRTTPSASTIRRRCAGLPPAAATSARSRRRRRAPTANAGPASRMISSIASPPRSPGTAAANRFPPANSGYRSAWLGGCASTCRETATSPWVLSCLTCAQVSGLGVATSQRSSPRSSDRVPGGGAVGSTRVVASRSVGSSTVPTTRKVRLPSARRTVPPTPAPTRRAAAGVRATSFGLAGARPVSRRRIPRASGSA
jgi:hypothetical protein